MMNSLARHVRSWDQSLHHSICGGRERAFLFPLLGWCGRAGTPGLRPHATIGATAIVCAFVELLIPTATNGISAFLSAFPCSVPVSYSAVCTVALVLVLGFCSLWLDLLGFVLQALPRFFAVLFTPFLMALANESKARPLFGKYHMERSILLCCNEIAFTTASAPFYSLKTMYDIYKVTAGWSGWPHDVTRAEQVLLFWEGIDALTDAAALVGYARHYPIRFSAVWGATMIPSFVVPGLLLYGRIDYKSALIMSLCMEDVWQLMIVIMICIYPFGNEVTEFMIYSAISSAFAVVKKLRLLISGSDYVPLSVSCAA